MGGSSGQQNTVSEFKPPSYTQQGWQDFVSNAGLLANTPYTQYQGMQQGAAPFNSDQLRAADMIYQTAVNGSPDTNAARGFASDSANGLYLGSNPWMSDQYANNVIAQNAQNMTNAYTTGTAAQRDASAARAGAYGGSGWKQATDSGAAGLANQVGQMANNYQLQRQGMGSQDWQGELNRMGQMSQLGYGGQGLDQNAANSLMNWGSAEQGLTNTLLGQAQGNFNQAQNYPMSMLQQYGNLLSQASGGGTTTQSGPGTNPWMTGLGLGTAAASAYNLFK